MPPATPEASLADALRETRSPTFTLVALASTVTAGATRSSVMKPHETPERLAWFEVPPSWFVPFGLSGIAASAARAQKYHLPSPTDETSAWQVNALTRLFCTCGMLQSASGCPPGVHGWSRVTQVQLDA